jgi:hypothetical protein
MPEQRPWASSGGLPTPHVAKAALHVAAIVDQRGSAEAEAQESYWHHATGGTYAPVDLERGQELLLAVGLLVALDDRLIPTPELGELLEGSADAAVATLSLKALQLAGAPGDDAAASDALSALVPDPAQREALLIALGRRFDDAQRRLVGEIGEEIVMAAARAELNSMGRPDVARQVQRVSLLSDQLGYDIRAPRVVGPQRLLEVKASVVHDGDAQVKLHLTRNEADTGAAYGDWSLVLCHVDDIEQRCGHVLGWCHASALTDLLPADATSGRWEQAGVELPLDRLVPGLPGAVS